MTRGVSRLLDRLNLVSRLMLAVTLCFAMAALALLHLTTHYAAINAKAELAAAYRLELEYLSRTITPAVLARDATGVKNAIESLRSSPAVIRVGFRDVSDTAGFSRETPAILTAPGWFADLCGNQPMAGTQPLTAKGVYFGLLTLDLSPIPSINLAWERTQRQLSILGLALTLVFVSIWLVLRHGLKPLQTLARGAHALSGGDFAIRLTPRGSPELRTSIEGFNRMAKSVERLVSEIQARNISLARSEENLRVTLRSIGDAVIACDAEGRVTMMNPVAEALTGWPLADAWGQPVREVFRIINEESRKEVESPVVIVLREGRIVGLANHTLLVAKDGSERPIADSGAPIRFSDDGEPAGVVLVFRDQTAEREHFNALRRSEALYASLADASPAGVFRFGFHTMEVEYANAKCGEIVGAGMSGTFDAEQFGRMIHAGDRAGVLAQWNAALRGEAALNVRFRLAKEQGSIAWVSLRTSPLKDEAGRITGLVGTVQDITKEQEQAARVEHLSRLYATLSGINDAIVRGSDSETLFARVCTVAHDVGKFTAAWIAVADGDSRRIELAGIAGDGDGRIRNQIERLRVDDEANLTATTLRTGMRQICNDFAADSRFRNALQDAVRISAGLGVPIKQGGKTVAALVLVADEKDYFSDDIIALADEIGSDISYALDNFARERQRREDEEQLRLTSLMFEKSRDAIIIADKDARILTVNPAFTEITGYGAEEVIGRKPGLLQSGRHDRAFYSGMWREVRETGFWQGEVWNRRKNGEIYPSLNSISMVRRPDGRPTHFLCLSADISEQKEFEARLTRLAFRDPLTDLPNRVLLRDRVEQHLAIAQREKQSVAMLFLDLDHFKNINDSLGHAMGDRLLVEVGRRMFATVRESDTVGRLGGDEFLLGLPDTDADAAAHVAQKLLDEISRPFLIDGQTLNITPSIGISLFPKDGRSFDALMKSADTAMYKAKETGRNAYCFASAEMSRAVLQRLLLESDLRRALERQEFVLFYQPQYGATGRRLVGLEALIRWRQPDAGFISPAQFIPVAEESGLIEPIGAWGLAETCRQIKAWLDKGFPPVRVGVNFSTRQFAARNLVDIVDRVLAQSGLPGELLEIEITESLLAGDMDRTLGVLKAFKQRGMHISVDDFGTGYSSLSYLKRFPIDRLKIDQSFVRDLVGDADDRAIAATVVALGHSLGMKVIAEGVETTEQLNILRDMGCDEVQGFLFARPMCADDMTTLLSGGVTS